MVYQCTNWHLCLESGMDLEYLNSVISLGDIGVLRVL